MAANNDNSAAQPAEAHLPLAELNDASNKSGGTWLVDAYCTFNHKYEYAWQGKIDRQRTLCARSLVHKTKPSTVMRI